MTDAQRTLKQMILEGIYVVDERSVARAIMARAKVRTTVARTSFRSDEPRGMPLCRRSARPDPLGWGEHEAPGF